MFAVISPENQISPEDQLKNIEKRFFQFAGAVEAGYDSKKAKKFRKKLRKALPAPTKEEARDLLPWVEALMNDLRAIAK